MFSTRSKHVGIPLAALLAGSVLVGCGAEETPVQEAEEEGSTAEAAILGEPVTIQNVVQEVVGPNTFTVGEEETLVVGAGMTSDLEEGTEVQVTGTVREFLVADFEDELGFDFEDEEESFVVDYEEELAIAATDVGQLPG